MRKVVPLVAFSALAFLGAASCSLFVSLDGLSDGAASSVDSGLCEAGTCADGASGTDGSPNDSGGAADDGPTLDAAINPCRDGGGTAGPRMIQAPGFCIDSTEVTVAQYSAFLQDGGVGVSQASECAWNLTFAPNTVGSDDSRCTAANIDPAARPQNPITCVDWCDAVAYCKWAGKRLCGAIAGGSVSYASFSTNSQWSLACATSENDTFPNDSNDGGSCQLKKTGTVAVASQGCNGGYPGLSDMVGNVEEWIDSCDTSGRTPDGGGAAFDQCHDEGGEFDENFTGPGCRANDNDNRRLTWAGVGFRCCSK
ncbi:MAG: SUMF1/EgtB/PvdO family nonheme iron enzyme [Polyangiaceae bacterium]